MRTFALAKVFQEMSNLNDIENQNFFDYNEYIRQKEIGGFDCTYDIVPESERRVRRKCSMDEIAILRTIRWNYTATEKQLADKLGKSEDEVKALIATLIKDGVLERYNINGKVSWHPLT